ncbi:hypothetical protein AMIS_18120 [Actinoplanes missouriensis 431]|uniref:DUF2231 domain-containing protein n=1 Tax=Actinoplanes missouriensis (strain ATCC 14538 / DSM 43046 / CBS 188.64 / JCM 3121 / NBRC 102363 / NCIMB 12654 / NRRL B-3342 / UNCC 431) TaxID=512565 RepID=I0H1Z5_ACTM4|nr:DUF2231 domain-containing protein [Actinoplanes missouriensis]BAL87032.1 hypothetical protein AMIS_18120 [Actinoplanes missouriensis 431]
MQSRLRLGGHPVQPLLLMFPLGLFVQALLFDLASLLGAPPLAGTLAFWILVGGLAGGLIAALAGGVDAFTARGPQAAREAFLSLLLDTGVLIFFAVLTLMRVRSPDRLAGPGLLAMEVLGLAVAVVGGCYGGRIIGPNRSPGMRRHAFSNADDAAGTRSRTVETEAA